MAGMPAFSLRGVTLYRRLPGPDGSPRRAAVLREVSAEIPGGELTLLMGPSGSGKSTLLRLLNRLEDPDDGEILLDGASLRSLPVIELRRRVVLVGQQPAPFPGSVRENLCYGPRLQGLSPSEAGERARAALRRAGLGDELLDRPAEQLSVGQQQRVCLARALALQPAALLLDEPTAALDPGSAATLLARLRELPAAGMTIVYVTHRLDEARELGGRALLLAEGRVVETGETRAVLDRPRSEAARAFFSAWAGVRMPP